MAEEIDLIWSPEALEQLEAIFKHIARDDLQAAERVALKIEELAEALVFTPEIGRIVPEYGRPELRERIHRPGKRSRYALRIIYRLRPGQIEIVSVWNTSRQGLPEL